MSSGREFDGGSDRNLGQRYTPAWELFSHSVMILVIDFDADGFFDGFYFKMTDLDGFNRR